jgi:uncharacterized membrane protein
MSWRLLLTLYGLMVAVSLGIGTAYFLIGLTLVLPFSGLEMLALGAALYITALRGGERQVITISDREVIIEIGRKQPEQRYQFQRAWARVILERVPASWYPSRLLIRSHGRELEIGRFLNEQERLGLANCLRQALANAGGAAGDKQLQDYIA